MKNVLKNYIVILMSILMATLQLQSYTVYAEDSITINCSADTYVRSGSKNKTLNYGTATSAFVDIRNISGVREGYIRFDYGKEAGESISVIENACYVALTLGVTTTTGEGELLVYGVDDSNIKTGWTETDLTYSKAMSLGLMNDTDYLTAVPFSNALKSSTVTIDVTDYVRSQTDGIYVFRITARGQQSVGDSNRFKTKELSVETGPQLVVYSDGDIGRVKRDISNIKIGNLSSVRGDFELPLSGENGTTISWRSSDASLLKVDGDTAAVTVPPSTDANDGYVILTAKVMSNSYSETREFEVFIPRKGVIDASGAGYIRSAVPSQCNMDQFIECGKDASSGIVSFDTTEPALKYAEYVELRLRPSTVDFGTKFIVTPLIGAAKAECNDDMTWDSAPSVVATPLDKNEYTPELSQWVEIDVTDYVKSQTDGSVAFKLDSTVDTVRFYGNAYNYKPQLMIYNYEKASSSESAVQAVLDELKIQSEVSQNIELPTKGKYGVNISWESSDENYITVDGHVTQPTLEDGKNKLVTLTATASREGFSKIKDYNVTVSVYVPDDVAVEYDSKHLSPRSHVLTNGGDLSVKGVYGSDISWESLSKDITINGDKYSTCRPISDLYVSAKLKANVKMNDEKITKEIDVKILRDSGKDLLDSRSTQDQSSNASASNDDDCETVWNPTESDAFAVFVMKKEANVGGIVIIPDNSQDILNVSVELSKDGKNYTEVYSSSQKLIDDLNLIDAGGVKAKYLKLSFKHGGNGGIRHIAAYEKQADDEANVINISELTIEEVSSLCNISVTSDFDVKTVFGDYAIEWESLNDKAIEISGEKARVTRTKNNEAVALKAKFTKNGITVEKIFTLTVRGKSSGSSSGGGSSGGGSSGGVKYYKGNTNDSNPNIVNNDKKSVFSDLEQAPWAENYIIELFDKGIVSGKGNGLFYPNEFVKREEFLKMLTKAAKMTKQGNVKKFSDVVGDEWYTDYINIAYSNGISMGRGDAFGVGEDILREEMAAMIYRTLLLKNYEFENKSKKMFSDINEASEYAIHCIEELCKIGIIGGDENNLVKPKNRLTRAESAKVLSCFLKITDKE